MSANGGQKKFGSSKLLIFEMFFATAISSSPLHLDFSSATFGRREPGARWFTNVLVFFSLENHVSFSKSFFAAQARRRAPRKVGPDRWAPDMTSDAVVSMLLNWRMWLTR
jgi:hypothetical protein